MVPRAIALSFVLLAACSSDTRPPGQGTGEVLQPPPNTGGSSSGGGSCETAGANEACIQSVKGAVLDGDGLGITLPINLCNAALCFSTSSDDGLFSVEVNKALDLSTFMIHAYGYPEYSDTFVPLERTSSATVTLGKPVYVARLAMIGGVVPELSAAPSEISAGPVSIALPAGATTTFYPAHDQRQLRAGAVHDPKRFDPAIVALYALGPFGASFSQKVDVAITLPAGTTMPDGTTLQVFVLDDDLASPTVAKLIPTGSALVQGNVARTAGGGISRLTWVGVRTVPSP